MAPKNSKGYRTPAEEQLRSFMEQAAAQGRAEEVLAIIQQSFDATPGVVDHQAMSDTSKRRPQQQSTWDDAQGMPPPVLLQVFSRCRLKWFRSSRQQFQSSHQQCSFQRAFAPWRRGAVPSFGSRLMGFSAHLTECCFLKAFARLKSGAAPFASCPRWRSVACRARSVLPRATPTRTRITDFKRRSPMTEAPFTMSTRTVRE